MLGLASEAIQVPPIAGFLGKGTPGRANSAASASLPPLVMELGHFPLQPRSTDPVIVTARISSCEPLASVRLETSLNLETNSTFLEMYDDGLHGDQAAKDGVYGVSIPAQASPTLVHYRVHATDSQSASTLFPYPDDPSPTQAYFHYDDDIDTQLTLFQLYISPSNLARLDANPYSSEYADCTLVINHEVYPHIGTHYRGRVSRTQPEHSWKFRFHKSQLYQGNRTYDTMFSIPLEQELAFEVFDRAGIDNLRHELIRMHMNGPFWGVYIGFESPTTGAWLDKRGYDPAGELYKARAGETPNQSKDSDLFHNQIVTDLDYWGAYNKKVRPLESPDTLRELVNAVNDLPDNELLPWLDAHVDLDQWFKRWALVICMNIDDFAVHNHYHFLPGESGGKWRWLGYDFDSGFTFNRVGALRPFCGDGIEGAHENWQRNKLCARVSANATLRRLYLLTLRRMLNEVVRKELLFPRLDALYARLKPDRQADAQRWGALRSSTTEAKNVLSSQMQSLSNYLAAAGLPAADKTPRISPTGGRASLGTAVSLAASPGWSVYFTTDGTDPRLSSTRHSYAGPFALTRSMTVKAAAIPAAEPLEAGNWSELAAAEIAGVPSPELAIIRQGGGILLAWPAAFPSQVVECVARLGDSWTELAVTPVRVGDQFEVAHLVTDAIRYYRLRKQ